MAALLLAARARALDLDWDCDTTAGYQPCSGSFDGTNFSGDGQVLQPWPGGATGLILPPTSGKTVVITVPGSVTMGKLRVLGAGYTLSGSGSLQLASAPTLFQLDSAATVSVRLAGSQTLEKSGPGTLVLGGGNTWTGLLRVLSDTVRVGSDSALGDTAGATSVETGGVLDLAGRSLGMEPLRLAGGCLVNQGQGQKNGVQRLDVTGNSSFGGATSWDIRRGLHPSPALDIRSGAVLRKIGASNVSVADVPVHLAGTLEVVQGRVVFNQGTRVDGAGSIAIDSGAGITVTTDTARVVVGHPIRMVSGYLESFNTSSTTEFSGDITLSGVVRNTVNNTGTMVLSGRLGGSGRVLSKWSEGILVLRNENSYTGILAVEGGELRIGDGGTAGSVASDTIRDNAAVVFDHSGTTTYRGRIHGAGTLARRGGGTTVFTGDLAHLGGTTILEGTMQIGDGGGTGSLAGTVDNEGTLVFDRTGAVVRGDTLRGSGQLVKRGSGTVVLSGPVLHTGATRIEAGALQMDGSCPSSTVAVGSGAVLAGRGTTGAVVVGSGTVQPGSIDTIGLLQSASLDLSGGTASTLRIRATGPSKPGIQYDRLVVSGAAILGGSSRLVLDLSRYGAPGTLTGVVQAGSVSGTFSTVEILGGGRWIVSVAYRKASVDVTVRDAAAPVGIDTVLSAGPDTVSLRLPGGSGLDVPPRDSSRRVVAVLVDSLLGHGISGADSALVLGEGLLASGPVAGAMPVSMIPVASRIAGARPSVFRIDPTGRVRAVPSSFGTDSVTTFQAPDDGAYWLGYDTVPPVVRLVLDHDSLGTGDSVAARCFLRDNVADSRVRLCLVLPGAATASCSEVGQGDSVETAKMLTESDIPLGASVRAEGLDTRSVARTPSTDVVAFLDTLQAPRDRLEDRYELLGFPYATGAGSAMALFRGLWGAPDPRRWRAWRYDSSGFSEVVEGDTGSVAGQGVWVRTRSGLLRSRVVGAWTHPVSRPFETVLAPGWNMVGNPYGVDVDWSAVRAASGLDSLAVSGPYPYDGSGSSWRLPDSLSRLVAWSGCAVHNGTGRDVVLRIPSVGAMLPAARQASPTPQAAVALRWSQGGRTSSWIRMGLLPGGAVERAYPLPPSPASSLRASILDSRAGSALLGDFVPDAGQAREWSLRLEGLQAGEPLVLEAVREGSDTAVAIRLRDEKSGRWLPLPLQTDFATAGEPIRGFTVVVGGLARVPSPGLPLAVSVRAGRLHWTLPAEGGRVRVRIELRDPSGRLVAIPVDETMDPGSYARDLGVARATRARVVVLRAGDAFRTVLFAHLR